MACLGIQPGTSHTLSETHATGPNSQHNAVSSGPSGRGAIRESLEGEVRKAVLGIEHRTSPTQRGPDQAAKELPKTPPARTWLLRACIQLRGRQWSVGEGAGGIRHRPCHPPPPPLHPHPVPSTFYSLSPPLLLPIHIVSRTSCLQDYGLLRLLLNKGPPSSVGRAQGS